MIVIADRSYCPVITIQNVANVNLLYVVGKFMIPLQNRRMEEVTEQINGYMLGTTETTSITSIMKSRS